MFMAPIAKSSEHRYRLWTRVNTDRGLKFWLCPLTLGKFPRLSVKLARQLFLTCCPEDERKLAPQAAGQHQSQGL